MKTAQKIKISSLRIFDEYIQEFQQLLHKLSNQFKTFSIQVPKASISNVEMFCIYSMVRLLKPECVFESGIYHGRSALLLAAAIQKNKFGRSYVASIDSFPEPYIYQKKYPFEIINMPGQKAIRQMDMTARTIMLIDGPTPGRHEGKKILNIASRFTNLLVLFQDNLQCSIKNWRTMKEIWKTLYRPQGYCYGLIDNKFVKKYQHLMDSNVPRECVNNIAALINPATLRKWKNN